MVKKSLENQGQEELRETLNQLVSANQRTLNQLMSAITLNQPTLLPQDLGTSVPEAVPNCERDDGIEAEDEYARVYFRVRSITQADWFAIPPRGVNVGTDGRLCPVFKEPPHKQFSRTVPFTVGPYFFLIIDEDPLPDNKLERSVHYLDMGNIEAGWEKAHSLRGSRECYFFVANDKIYALVSSKDAKIFLKFLDCHNLKDGWQSKFPKGDNCSKLFSNIVFAFMLEYEATTESAQVKHHARRALIFTEDCRISYDFNTNALSVSEEVLWNFWGYRYRYCKGVCLDDMMYMLCEDEGDFYLVAYNHRDRKWCPTPVIGLENCDNAFPFIYPDGDALPAKLVHLGKRRLCLLWPHTTGQTTLVHCTKFDVRVSEGQHYAENVSTEVYKVTCSGIRVFEAISISSE